MFNIWQWLSYFLAWEARNPLLTASLSPWQKDGRKKGKSSRPLHKGKYYSSHKNI